MNEEFENFNDADEEWLTELEIRTADLENELFDLREAHARELENTSYGRDGAPRGPRDSQTGALRAQPRQAHPRQVPPRQAPLPGAQFGEELHHVIEDEDPEPDEDDLTTIIRTGTGHPARLAALQPRRTADQGAYPDAHRPRTAQRPPRSQAALPQDRPGRGRPRRPHHHRIAAPVPDEAKLADKRGHGAERDHDRLPEPQRRVRARPAQLRLRQDHEPDLVGVRPDDERRQPAIHRREDRQARARTDHADTGRRGGLVA